jgi:hypothetical protein
VTQTAIRLLRGVGGCLLAAFAPGANNPNFWTWSSLSCLLLCAVYTVGLVLRWPPLALPSSCGRTQGALTRGLRQDCVRACGGRRSRRNQLGCARVKSAASAFA